MHKITRETLESIFPESIQFFKNDENLVFFCIAFKGGFPIHRTASLRLKSPQTRQTSCTCDFSNLYYPHIGSRGKVSDTFSSAIIGFLLLIISFKIDKIWHNFLISGPILIIKVPLFSVFNTQYYGIKNKFPCII